MIDFLSHSLSLGRKIRIEVTARVQTASGACPTILALGGTDMYADDWISFDAFQNGRIPVMHWRHHSG